MPHRTWAAFFVFGAVLLGKPAAGQSSLTVTALTSLASLERRAERPKLFQHLPPDSDGWSVTQTRNFRIRHRSSQALAERVARAAEPARSAAFLRWFCEVGTSWKPRCEIYLYPSGAEFRRATGLAEAVSAVSTTQGEAGRVFSRRIDLYVGAANLLDAILPHEVTHIVLADHFGGDLPPWAGEGMAVQVEPRHRVRLHLRHLPTYREQNRVYSAGDLIAFRGYPDSRQMGPFYAQSVSLVEFLLKQQDAQTLVRFLHDGPTQGHEKALRRHYGFGLAELNRRWLRYAFAVETADASENGR